jgi:hypothetical protein
MLIHLGLFYVGKAGPYLLPKVLKVIFVFLGRLCKESQPTKSPTACHVYLLQSVFASASG